MNPFTLILRWIGSQLGVATKTDLEQLELRMNEKIQAYTDAVNAKMDEIGTSVDGLNTALTSLSTAQTGIAGDVAFLKAEIEKINNSPGTLSPEDQASLDAALARLGGLTDRVAASTAATKAAADALTALDAATDAAPPAPANP